MGPGGAPAREISFVSSVAYGPKVSDSALTMGVTASETRQGSSQQSAVYKSCPGDSDVGHMALAGAPSVVRSVLHTGQGVTTGQMNAELLHQVFPYQ